MRNPSLSLFFPSVLQEPWAGADRLRIAALDAVRPIAGCDLAPDWTGWFPWCAAIRLARRGARSRHEFRSPPDERTGWGDCHVVFQRDAYRVCGPRLGPVPRARKDALRRAGGRI